MDQDLRRDELLLRYVAADDGDALLIDCSYNTRNGFRTSSYVRKITKAVDGASDEKLLGQLRGSREHLFRIEPSRTILTLMNVS